MAFDMARESRIAKKEVESFHMDKKMYELEVERTRNLGNMTSTLLMLASSMDALTMYYVQPSAPLFSILCVLYNLRGCLTT